MAHRLWAMARIVRLIETRDLAYQNQEKKNQYSKILIVVASKVCVDLGQHFCSFFKIFVALRADPKDYLPRRNSAHCGLHHGVQQPLLKLHDFFPQLRLHHLARRYRNSKNNHMTHASHKILERKKNEIQFSRLD